MGIISSLKKKTGKALPRENAAPVSMPAAPKGAATRKGFSAVIVKPYLSEKSLLSESVGTYTFVVSREATKHAVLDAVEQVYGIRPSAVRMINSAGKSVRFGRGMGRR